MFSFSSVSVFLFSLFRFYLVNPRVFCPCIESNTTTTFKAQKGGKDIVKVVHVTSVVQP